MLMQKNTGYYRKRVKVKETRPDIDNGKIINYATESPMKIESRHEPVRAAATTTKPKAKAEQAAPAPATSTKHAASAKASSTTSATKEKHSETAADVMKQAHEQAAKNPVEQQIKRVQSVNVTA